MITGIETWHIDCNRDRHDPEPPMQFATSQHATARDSQRPGHDERVCEQPALAGPGNQALVEDAGLEPAARDEGGTWLDDMADFVLDLLPFDAAVAIARQRPDDAGVQRWADAQAPQDVLGWVQRRGAELLAAAWPEGTGLTGEAALGGELGLGADVAASVQLLRADADHLALSAEQHAQLGLGGDGAGVALRDAFGEQVAGLGAGMGVSLVADHGLSQVIDFDLVDMVAAGVLRSTGPLGDLLLGVAAPLVRGADTALADALPASGWTEETRLSVGMGGGAGARMDVAPDLLSPALLRQVPELAELAHVIDALVSVSGQLRGTLRTGTDGVGLTVVGGVDALLQLSSTLPALAELAGWPELLDGMRQQDGFEVELDLGLQVVDGQVLPVQAHSLVHMRHTGGDASGAVTDRTTCPLAQVASLFSTGPDGVDALLAASGSGWERQVELPVRGEQVAGLVPSVASLLLDMGVAPAVQARTSFLATGRIEATGDVLASLAGQGIAGPEGWSAAAVVQAVGASLVALRAGAPLPHTWLEPHRARLGRAADALHLQDARIQGSVQLGLGGEVELPGFGATSRASAGLCIDQPVQAGETDAIERRLIAQA